MDAIPVRHVSVANAITAVMDAPTKPETGENPTKTIELPKSTLENDTLSRPRYREVSVGRTTATRTQNLK